MKYISAFALLLATGCSVTTNHSSPCDMSENTHVCPEEGHGPCPFCPPVKEKYTNVRITEENIYDSEEQERKRASELSLRFVDYLHLINTDKIER